MYFKKMKLLSMIMVGFLTGCVGYGGVVDSGALSDDSLNNSFRELSVTIDENDTENPYPRYFMDVALTNFGFMGKNTIRVLGPITVTYKYHDPISLNGSEEASKWLNLIFWYLPSIPPFYMYYGVDKNVGASDVNQVNYSYTVKLNDKLPIVEKQFIDPILLQKIYIENAVCSDTNHTCSITTDAKTNDSSFKYTLLFEPQNTQDNTCDSRFYIITSNLGMTNTFTSPVDQSLKFAKCQYILSISAKNTINNGQHDRLQFTYITKSMVANVIP